MKKSLLRIVVVTAALATAGAVTGQAPGAADKPAVGDKQDVTARLRKTLEARLPKIHIEKVQPSQWPYLYEVVTDEEMFYVDAGGDYLFYGKVMDTRTREDLTGKRWNELQQVDFSSLPLNLAFKQVKGDGSRKVVVFADPHCPFCVRFEKTLQEVTNITVYTFLYPLETIHPGATDRAKQIWCAQDRQAAWDAWMLNKKDMPSAVAKCNTDALGTLKDLGDKLKVNGTPTLIFEDGHRVPGAIDKAQLEQEFKSVAKKS